MNFGGQNVIYFVIQQVAALLAHGNELPYLIVFLFDSQRQGVLQKTMPEAAFKATRKCKSGPESSIGKTSNQRNASFGTRAQIDSAWAATKRFPVSQTIGSTPLAPPFRRGALHINLDATRRAFVT